MKPAAALALLLLPVLPSRAAAQAPPRAEPQRYDLRARYLPRVGDEVVVHEVQRQRRRYRIERQGEVLENHKGSMSVETRYEQRVEKVEQGVVVGELRRYRLVKQVRQGEPREERFAEPIEVRLVLREKRWVWARLGAADEVLPPLLKAKLAEECAGEVEPGGAEAKLQGLFPQQPQALGARWKVAPATLAEVLGFEHVDPQTSTAEGELRAVRGQGEAQSFTVRLRFALELRRVLGERVETPARLSGEATLELRPRAPSRSLRVQAALSYAGALPGQSAPPGTKLRLRLDVESQEVRSPLEDRQAGPRAPKSD